MHPKGVHLHCSGSLLAAATVQADVPSYQCHAQDCFSFGMCACTSALVLSGQLYLGLTGLWRSEGERGVKLGREDGRGGMSGEGANSPWLAQNHFLRSPLHSMLPALLFQSECHL